MASNATQKQKDFLKILIEEGIYDEDEIEDEFNGLLSMLTGSQIISTASKRGFALVQWHDYDYEDQTTWPQVAEMPDLTEFCEEISTESDWMLNELGEKVRFVLTKFKNGGGEIELLPEWQDFPNQNEVESPKKYTVISEMLSKDLVNGAEKLGNSSSSVQEEMLAIQKLVLQISEDLLRLSRYNKPGREYVLSQINGQLSKINIHSKRAANLSQGKHEAKF